MTHITDLRHNRAQTPVIVTLDPAVNKPTIQQLDEIAQSQPGALEAALEEMVNSGFGDLEHKLPQAPAPTPGPTTQCDWGWW